MPLISSTPMQQVIAGPPKCAKCGSIMQIWIPAATRDKVPPYKPFLWMRARKRDLGMCDVDSALWYNLWVIWLKEQEKHKVDNR